MKSESAVLQAVRLKGRPGAADVATAAGISEQDAAETLRSLAESGACKEVNERFMLTPPGRERLDHLLTEERAGLDKEALGSLYEEFNELNTELKEILHDWQVRDGVPNNHLDAEHDQRVLDRLASLDDRFAPLAERFAVAVPRLAPYPGRFANALERVQEGDRSWIAHPIADSYHTVWFELHEELLGALGLSREAEAAAGRAE